MIVTCPECGARYRVDDAALPTAGRTVRCRNCGHQWRQRPDGQAAGEPASVLPVPVAPPTTPEPPSDLALETERAVAIPAEEPADALMPVRGSLAEEPAAPGATADSPQSRRLMMGWIALAAIVLLILAAAAIFRDRLVAAWPPAGRLYAAIGWPAKPGSGLQFSNVKVSSSLDNGQPILVLTGDIIDVSQVALGVPKLHVYLLGDKQQVLRRIEMDPTKPSLRPGETSGFSYNIQEPPPDARWVRMAFAAP